MGKTITKTFEEIDKEWTPEKIRAVLDNAPSFPDDITDEDVATGRVKFIGRGFAAYKEHINRNGRPKSAEKKVTVTLRLPEHVVAGLRATKGYSRLLSDYVMAGINSGALSTR
jgi:uncharacterized protein (DUF4415 family)